MLLSPVAIFLSLSLSFSHVYFVLDNSLIFCILVAIFLIVFFIFIFSLYDVYMCDALSLFLG